MLERELQQLKDQQAAQESASLSSSAKLINGVKLLVSQLDNVEPKCYGQWSMTLKINWFCHYCIGHHS